MRWPATLASGQRVPPAGACCSFKSQGSHCLKNVDYSTFPVPFPILLSPHSSAWQPPTLSSSHSGPRTVQFLSLCIKTYLTSFYPGPEWQVHSLSQGPDGCSSLPTVSISKCLFFWKGALISLPKKKMKQCINSRWPRMKCLTGTKKDVSLLMSQIIARMLLKCVRDVQTMEHGHFFFMYIKAKSIWSPVLRFYEA